MIRTFLVCAVVSAFSASAQEKEKPAEHTLKLGSLAPRESPWGQVLRTWAKAVKQKTDGRVAIEFFWNASQGDEGAQVSKVKLGQLDGAVVTAIGLGAVDPTVNVLQLPGMYKNWEELDKVRDALRSRFEDSFKKQGYVLVGWGDIGLDRWMSKGYPVAEPNDLKGKRPWVWKDDPFIPTVLQVIKDVTPVLKSVPEAVAELSTGNANGMSVSALGAEQLQWSSRLDNLSEDIIAPNIGGILVSEASLKPLSEADRTVVLELGKVTCGALTSKIRGEDKTAYDRLVTKMTLVKATPEQRAKWAAVYKEAWARIGQAKTLPPELIAEVQKLLSK